MLTYSIANKAYSLVTELESNGSGLTCKNVTSAIQIIPEQAEGRNMIWERAEMIRECIIQHAWAGEESSRRRRVSREWYPSNGLTQNWHFNPSHTMQTPGLDPLTARVFEKLPDTFPRLIAAHSLPPQTLSDSPVDTTLSLDVNHRWFWSCMDHAASAHEQTRTAATCGHLEARGGGIPRRRHCQWKWRSGTGHAHKVCA